MKDDLLERLAREAGRHEVAAEHRVPPGEHGSFIASTDWVRRFAARVAEECAKVCEQNVSTDTDWDNAYWNQSAERCAWKIRDKFT